MAIGHLRRRPLTLFVCPLYHDSVCPELRLSAEIGQLLPALEVHGPLWNGKENARHTLTVDGRRTVMIATKAHLPPWSPLPFSIRLQRTEDSVVQGQSDLSTGAHGCQRLLAQSQLPRWLSGLSSASWLAPHGPQATTSSDSGTDKNCCQGIVNR